MDEDAGGRAPVTRLRRRLSVEQTERSKSPAVNTPTKRRGRNTTKPELDLIDESTPDNSTTKSTTKTGAAKDVRVPDEVPVTPGRRSARVKSTTSIISETAPAVESPRARRATRRASLAGNDNEATLTPVTRQTHRTRKDSTSSIEKEPQHQPTQGLQIKEVIIEEPEVNTIKSEPQPENATGHISSPNSTRKSPRLSDKNISSPTKITVEESGNDITAAGSIAPRPDNCNVELDFDKCLQGTADQSKNNIDVTKTNKISQYGHSIPKSDLVRKLHKDVTKNSNINKSWSEAGNKPTKTKRHRTKSSTTLSTSNDIQFYSDNENAKMETKNKNKPLKENINISGSGDILSNLSLNQSLTKKSGLKTTNSNCLNFLIERIGTKSTIVNPGQEAMNVSVGQKYAKNNDAMTSELLEKGPSGDIKTTIYIDVYDTNSEKINVETRGANEDQCVPVVDHPEETSPIKVNTFTSCLDEGKQNIPNKSKEVSHRKDSEQMEEPMDIDETITENLIIIKSDGQSPNVNSSIRKCNSVNNPNISNEEIVNKSKGMSSTTQNLDKSEFGTKSTLILSQIRDTSTRDMNVVKSPQAINNNLLSESVDNLNITQENNIKKNVSLHYSTSTPLQDKNDKKLIKTHVNTSVTIRNVIDDEALDAGDSYESGDSQDESERKHQRENEVIDKGKTLTSDEELSNDDDYEKNSFVVSSNEEDVELSDLTGDDLSMSDKVLEMTAKSKKKYDKQKLKEQKEASREVFESRHKLNSFNKSTNSDISWSKKNKRQQITSSESDEDIRSRKNNRLRLDSTKEASLLAYKSEHRISMKKVQRLDSYSSSDESVPHETEITINNKSIIETDPLFAQIKTEPKTPQRSCNTTIAFIDSEGVDNDQININESTKTQSEFLDPLQATMVDDDDDFSMSSDNENIMQNFDSVLKNLNRSNKSKPKACDISLNLYNKKSKKEKNTIIEELNLTQLKSDKKTNNKPKENVRTNVNEILPNNVEDEDSSDTINLNLLFSEDSYSSDASIGNSEQIIPLKRTKGKTDIRKNNDVNNAKDVSLYQSINKKNEKRDSSHNITSNEENVSFFIDTVGSQNKNQTGEEIDFAMNEPTRNIPSAEESTDDAPHEISYHKQRNSKQKSNAQDKSDTVAEQTGHVLDKSINKSLALTPATEKKSKENTTEENMSTDADVIPISLNKSISKTPSSEKKHVEENIADNTDVQDTQIQLLGNSNKKKRKKSDSNSYRAEVEKSFVSDNQDVLINLETSGQKKQKKAGTEPPAIDISADNLDILINLETSGKKKQKKAETEPPPIDISADNKDLMNFETSEKKKQKKAKREPPATDISADNQDVLINLETSGKKKQKKAKTEPPPIDITAGNKDVLINVENSRKKKQKKVRTEPPAVEISDGNQNVLSNLETSGKKKQKKAKTEPPPIDISADNKDLMNLVISGKKKQKKAKTDPPAIDISADNKDLMNLETGEKKKQKKAKTEPPTIDISADNIDVLINMENKGKKKQLKQKKKEAEVSTEPLAFDISAVETSDNMESISKKRKRKFSPNTTIEGNQHPDVHTDQTMNELLANSKKKKRKVLGQDNNVTVAETEIHDESRNKKQETQSPTEVRNLPTEIDEINKKRNKKRKKRDDDIISSKMLKSNTFEKVPRLPTALLEKLDDDKEAPSKKPKLIGMTQFNVEETIKRKNKPSLYSEESVYISNSPKSKSNKKKRNKKPKVLPFMPISSTSCSGFTTNFKVNVLPNDIMTFTAQSNTLGSLWDKDLNRVRRIQTYNQSKKKKNSRVNMSKF